jgi:hypothetical protein
MILRQKGFPFHLCFVEVSLLATPFVVSPSVMGRVGKREEIG